ncbi:MAG: class IV adenylate cyclase [Planctomycetes bacterium]|nr:class IV adenylate cyclase [Planctomycetota bacterium]
MAREVEIKFRLRSREALEARLLAIGATYHGTELEKNALFDREDGALRRAGEALRLRQTEALDEAARARATLTWKGPRRPGPLKDREERESEVSAPDDVRAILIALGCAPLLEFEKRRSTWRWGSAEIALDEVAPLGSFLEIEADPAEIERAIEALGLRDGDLDVEVEERSYPELVREARDRAGNATIGESE